MKSIVIKTALSLSLIGALTACNEVTYDEPSEAALSAQHEIENKVIIDPANANLVTKLPAGQYLGSVIEKDGTRSLALGFFGENSAGFVVTVDNDQEQASRVYLTAENTWTSNSSETFTFARSEKVMAAPLSAQAAAGDYQIWHAELGEIALSVFENGDINVSAGDSCTGTGSLGENISNGLNVSLKLIGCGIQGPVNGLLWQDDDGSDSQLRLVSFNRKHLVDWYLQ